MTDHSFRVEHGNAVSYAAMAFWFALVLILAAAPFWADRHVLWLLSEIYFYIALATLWNLLAGYAGLVSVGQQAYVGLGGYLLFGLTMFAGLPPLWSVPVAGLAGALVAIPIAALIFRLRGHYFAIGTWVVAEVFRLLASQISALGGGSGISLPVSVIQAVAPGRQAREMTVYALALGFVLLIFAASFALLRSRYGLALAAIRDNETAARASGVDVQRLKFAVYVATACGTSMVGALVFLQKIRISPETAFSVNDWTAVVIFITVIGGIGRLEGPILGTIIFFTLRQLFADLGALYLLLLGAVAIGIMLKAPHGLWGMIADRLGWQLFPLDRRIAFAQPANRKR